MKLTKRLINKFNQPNTILVLSKWPYKNEAKSYHGVAVYTKETLSTVAKKTSQKFVVLVQAEFDREIHLSSNGNILIIPAFYPGIKLYPQILNVLSKFSKINTYHIHSEFYNSGDIIQMGLIIPFLSYLKIRGKHLSFFAHNVIDNFDFIANLLGVNKNHPSLIVLKTLVPWYYKLLSLGTSRIVCLDESVKNKLKKHIREDKLMNIPIWVYPKNSSLKIRQDWRQKLGFKKNDLVLMVFGFVSKYKGIDWLTKTVEQNHFEKKVKLLIAGGPAPSHQDKKHYQDFYQQLQKQAASNSKITLTGFIDKKDLSGYFAAADLVILPYRGILGSSASLSSTLTYGKPFLLSNKLRPYLENQDFVETLKELSLNQTELTFKISRANFLKTINNLNQTTLKKIALLSKRLANKRSPQARLVEERLSLYSAQNPPILLQWKGVRNLAKILSN